MIYRPDTRELSAPGHGGHHFVNPSGTSCPCCHFAVLPFLPVFHVGLVQKHEEGKAGNLLALALPFRSTAGRQDGREDLLALTIF